jgi:hypothetical protein
MLVLRTKCLFVLAMIGSLTLGPAVSAQDKELAKKLKTKISLKNGIPAKTTLNDALALFADDYQLTIIVNTKAFEGAPGIQRIEEEPVELKPVKDVELGKVLQKLLDPLGATYKTEKGDVVIVPKG